MKTFSQWTEVNLPNFDYSSPKMNDSESVLVRSRLRSFLKNVLGNELRGMPPQVFGLILQDLAKEFQSAEVRHSGVTSPKN